MSTGTLTLTVNVPAAGGEGAGVDLVTDPLGEICFWSELREKTCAHCTYGRFAYIDFPSAEELWT